MVCAHSVSHCFATCLGVLQRGFANKKMGSHMLRRQFVVSASLGAFILAAPAIAASGAPTPTSGDAALLALLDAIFADGVRHSPQSATSYGLDIGSLASRVHAFLTGRRRPRHPDPTTRVTGPNGIRPPSSCNPLALSRSQGYPRTALAGQTSFGTSTRSFNRPLSSPGRTAALIWLYCS